MEGRDTSRLPQRAPRRKTWLVWLVTEVSDELPGHKQVPWPNFWISEHTSQRDRGSEQRTNAARGIHANLNTLELQRQVDPTDCDAALSKVSGTWPCPSSKVGPQKSQDGTTRTTLGSCLSRKFLRVKLSFCIPRPVHTDSLDSPSYTSTINGCHSKWQGRRRPCGLSPWLLKSSCNTKVPLKTGEKPRSALYRFAEVLRGSP